ncbi:ATP-binding protein [Streptomyces boncukensis]|uniref:ATP-binding protein n=1 Tax=Streptomyces boncukensis TaxID=2711219 RepID=UPI0030B9CAB6
MNGASPPGPRTTPSWHIELPHSPPAAPIARAVVRNALTELESPVDSGTAELLVCELVTNAIEHTHDDAAISLSVTALPEEGVLVEVRDRGPGPLEQRQWGLEGAPEELREDGRGLQLIQMLSSACGSRATRDGKTVWFTLASRGSEPEGALRAARPEPG